MKKNYILVIAVISSIGFLAMQKSGVESVEKFLAKNGHKNSAGAPTGKTGAPGESNCTDCHVGTTQSGAGINNLTVLDGSTPVTNYTTGVTYNVSLNLTTGDVKEGFQATVLDGSNVMAGSFPGTGGLGTAITSAGGRNYANHTATSNNEGNFAWVWEWNAPAVDMGSVTFYVATNIANGNGNNTGDVIYLSTHVIGSTAGLNEETADNTNFTAGYASANNKVIINFNSLSVGDMFFNLVDLNGKSVFTYKKGESSIGENSEAVVLPSEIKSGIYVVNFFVGNKAMSSKIMIQK